MWCHRLAPLAAAAGLVGTLAGALAGCTRPAVASPAPPVVIAVAPVDAPPIGAGATSDAPHSSAPDDGHAAGERVAVESHGSWLPATLIERRGDRWLVRYDAAWGGARDSLEELVERDRIRVPVERVDEDHTPDDVDP